jgi:flagellar basal body rod protein FlgG
MYLSTMGAMAESSRHGVVANNLANTETIGYKPDRTNFKELLSESLLQPGHRMEIDKVLEKTGGGVWLNDVAVQFQQGAMRETGNPLHAAITDENGFFTVKKDGEDYLTRDGAFSLNPNGELVLSDGKTQVLNIDGEPINLGEIENLTGLEILADGKIQAAGTNDIITTIGTAKVEDLRTLSKRGDNLFQVENGETTPGGVTMRGGVTESSAVDPVMEMVTMIAATRAYQTNMKFISIQDETLGRTVSTVGSVRG